MPGLSAAGLQALAGSGLPNPASIIPKIAGLPELFLNRKLARKDYETEKADTYEFWRMNNEYNAPSAQMERFRAAGLNPNLIYGQGSAGNANAPSPPDLTSVRSESRDAPSVDFMQPLLMQADLDMKKAQTSNILAQNDVILQDAALRRWQAERAGFDLAFEQKLEPFSADARREFSRKARIENDVLLNRDVREAAKNASDIKEATERILNMRDTRFTNYYERRRIVAQTKQIRESIKLMEQDGTLKSIEIELRRNNINPGDPAWVKYLGLWLGRMFDSDDPSGRPIDGYGIWKAIFGDGAK